MKDFYDDRYRTKLTGDIERISAFHLGDYEGMCRDISNWELVRNGMCILEAGCGWATYLDGINRGYEVRAIKTDLSYVALQALSHPEQQMARNNLLRAVADLQALPFKDGSYDLLLCSQVLEHIPDDEKAISECYRVLKNGGVLFITVPNCYRDMYSLFHPLGRLFDESGHIHEYPIESIRTKLEYAGFSITKERYYCFFIFWVFASLERMKLGKLIQKALNSSPLLAKLTQYVLMHLIMAENRLLGDISNGSLSMEFVAIKR